MPRLAALTAAAAVLVAIAADASATIVPGRGMSGVAIGLTKAQLRARLGAPVVATSRRWYYPRVQVGFRTGRVVELTTTRSVERTRAGLGVDSTEAAVRAAYPQLVCTAENHFRRCRLGGSAPGSRVTDFVLGRGRVLQVTVALVP
jgi:hypothetical protein